MKYVHYSCDEVKQMFNQLFPNISEKFDNCEILCYTTIVEID